MCLRNLYARFTPIFLNLTLISICLCFAGIERKSSKEKAKSIEGKTCCSMHWFAKVKRRFRHNKAQASKRRSLGFASVKIPFIEAKEVLIRRHPRVRLGEAYLRQGEACLHQGEERLSRLKTHDLRQGWNSKPRIFSPF